MFLSKYGQLAFDRWHYFLKCIKIQPDEHMILEMRNKEQTWLVAPKSPYFILILDFVILKIHYSLFYEYSFGFYWKWVSQWISAMKSCKNPKVY